MISTTSSTNLRWFKFSPSTFIYLLFQLISFKTSSRAYVNNFGQMASRCLTPLLIGILLVLSRSRTWHGALLYMFYMIDQVYTGNGICSILVNPKLLFRKIIAITKTTFWARSINIFCELHQFQHSRLVNCWFHRVAKYNMQDIF